MKKNTIKKLIAYAFSLSMLMVTLTACTIDNSDKVELQELPETLTIDCEIPEDYSETVSIYSIEYFADYDVEKATELLFEDKEYQIIYTDEVTRYAVLNDGEYSISEDSPYKDAPYYENFFYYNEEYVESVGSANFQYSLYDYTTDEDIINSAKEDEDANELNEEYLNEFQCFIDEVFVGLDIRLYDMNFKKDRFALYDAAYVCDILVYRQYVDDIPIGIEDEQLLYGYGQRHISIHYTLVDGMVVFYATGTTEIGEEVDIVEIVSPNVAINNLIDTHNETLINNFETIIDVELIYVLQHGTTEEGLIDKDSVNLYPVWSVVTASTSDPDNAELYTYYIFDSQDGSYFSVN